MPEVALTLSVLQEQFAVCRLDPGQGDAGEPCGSLWCTVRDGDGLTVICQEEDAPAAATPEPGWRALKVAGSFDFSAVGVLASIASPLAEAGVSILAVSTYDTDYVLVKQTQLDRALAALAAAGHTINSSEEANP